jgi:hypothetical protein
MYSQTEIARRIASIAPELKTVSDVQGKTPLDHARERNLKALLEILTP